MSLSKLKINMMGFIFYKASPRYFNNALSFDEVRQIPKTIKKVGVFVNEPVYSIFNTVAQYDLDFVQLHGEESIGDCKELMPYVHVIKVISVKDKSSINKMLAYENACDYFLFDTATATYGGSGKSFDHDLLKEKEIIKPFFISGGISIKNVNELKDVTIKNFTGIDVNSKFELRPGLKDIEKIKQLLKHTTCKQT